MDKFVVAVVGCGRIADAAHLPALSKMEDVRIKYACDLIPEKAEAAKEKYGCENVITDYHIALSDPEVEAVYVLTPNYAHYTVTMDALRAGKHVFCEKPITVNYPLSVEMAREAEKQGKILNIGVCNRYHESVIRLQEMNARGDFGNIYHVVCNFRQHRCIPGLGGAFTTKSQSGGGVLIDWGIHYLDLILYILGNPNLKTVSADAFCEMAKSIPDYKFEDMWAGPVIPDGVNDVDDCVAGHVRTTGASISFNGAWAENIGPAETYIDFLGDKCGARLKYCGHFTLWDNDLKEDTPEYEIPDMYAREDADFIKSCRTGVRNRNYIDNILESMKLLDAIYASAEKHEEIKL